METALQRNGTLINRKFNSYLVPGVMMTVAMQLGNIIDCIFVSRWIDLDGLSAISLSMPVLFVMQMVGMTIGGGCAATISVMLGRRQIDEASETVSASVFAVIAASLVFTVLAPFIVRPLASVLTPSPLLAGMLEEYLFLFMLLIPFLNLCILVTNVVTVDNHPKLGAACFIIASIVNLSTEYIFLNYTDLGMRGAALSTIIGYGTGLVVVIPYMRSPRRIIAPGISKILPGMKTFRQVVKAGIPQTSLTVVKILQFLTVNTLIQKALGPDYLAIYAVCMNAVTIVRLFIDGVIGLIQTIAGVLYGEKDYYGIRALVRRTAVTAAGIAILLTVFFLVFPQALLALFSFNKPALYGVALTCVRLYSLSFLLFAANRIVQVYYQATLHPSLSSLDTVLQGFVWLVPMMLLMMRMMGIEGVCLSVGLAEAMTWITVWIYRSLGQRRGKLPQKGFLMIPDRDSHVLLDVTISSTEEDAVQLGKTMMACCREHGIPAIQANCLCMAAEELSVNISRYGYSQGNPCAIDICLSAAEESLILRLRDDGIPFDPTVYGKKDVDVFEMGGLEMIRRITSKMTYTRVLNMNNTIIEVRRGLKNQRKKRG